ncbi:hyoscyamine 6-dioxygenase-like [Coffea arabica]|uniref:Hyoscyamine 6-dioxygenase-like n=1 Tax=Coffea arabica TaxID=13443 RepID=A0A6P6VK08_COFAR|nr:hyoscyamine 6-dioxygenase-like [Coffea arabica]XP_027103333.1 hyoscyamine 6-dioxygenase-like [Coffea arabica]
MANLLSSWSSDPDSLPEKYIVPEEKRPGALLAPVSKDIPAIDLSEGDRASIIQKIMKASQEFGFFQVINHGVSEKLMIDAVNVGKEFFSMPAEEMENFAAKDSRKGCKVYTGSGNYGSHDFGLWRDTLQHPCHPLEKWTNIFPDKPAGYRGTIGPYTVEVRKLGIRILDMICEGLGLTEENYDYHDLLLMIHNYPACPDPSSALGVSGHRDANLITIIQQDIYGLQLFKDGQWIGVEPLPNAFASL